MAYREDRLGELHRRQDQRVRLVADRVVGQRILQLRDRCQIARLHFRNGRWRLPLQELQAADTLADVARPIVDRRIGFERAGDDAEHRDAPGKRIRDGLPHEGRHWCLVVRLTRSDRTVSAHVREGTFNRRRQDADDGVEQLRNADVQDRGRADEREEFALERRRTQTCDELVVGERAGLEEVLHQLLVRLGDHLDQRLARVLDIARHLGGNRALLELAFLATLVDVRLARHQVDDASDGLLFADRQLQRNHRAAARVAQRLQRSFEAGALAIDAVDDDQARQVQFVSGLPDFLGLHHHTGHRVDDHDRRVDDVQCRPRVAEEVADTRRVDDVDLVLVPLGVGEACRERVLAGDLLFVEIGDRRPVVHLAEPVDHARVCEDGRSQLCLARSGVTNERDVAYRAGVVNLHGKLSLRPHGRSLV
ncbi:MAG: hypothetical protein QM736_21505 [Vicinamibacterales bacterium]